ncbi:hypothetical protein DSUL_140048 [Desulfovibrionales bacterium]
MGQKPRDVLIYESVDESCCGAIDTRQETYSKNVRQSNLANLNKFYMEQNKKSTNSRALD